MSGANACDEKDSTLLQIKKRLLSMSQNLSDSTGTLTKLTDRLIGNSDSVCNDQGLSPAPVQGSIAEIQEAMEQLAREVDFIRDAVIRIDSSGVV